jgi:hypothetical protein
MMQMYNTISKASFEVAWLIARNNKPYTIGGELDKTAALKMVEIMCGQKEAMKLNSVPLPAKVVKERIPILAENSIQFSLTFITVTIVTLEQVNSEEQ